MKLLDLPPRIRNKIIVNKAEERTACWEWTGSYIAPRCRYAEYRTPKADTGRFRNMTGSLVNDRGLPNVHSRELGYPTGAHRVVYAALTKRPLRMLPILQRCVNDRCVSPYHVLELGPARSRRRTPTCETAPDPEPAECPPGHLGASLTALQAADVSTLLDPASAALEAGLEPDQITPEIWAAYVAWDEART